MASQIQATTKAAKSALEKITNVLWRLEDARQRLPEIRDQAVAARKAASVDDDKTIEILARANMRVELQEAYIPRLIEEEIPALVEVGGKALEDLNSAIMAAAAQEREKIIADAAAAIAPWCGPEPMVAFNGEKHFPSRVLAEQVPALSTLPSTGNRQVGQCLYFGPNAESNAANMRDALKQSLDLVTRWQKNGEKFAFAA